MFQKRFLYFMTVILFILYFMFYNILRGQKKYVCLVRGKAGENHVPYLFFIESDLRTIRRIYC